MTAARDVLDAAGAVRPAAVEVHGARKAYGANVVLDGIDLTVRPGTVTVILGPSGSGKSTLLRAINHLEKLDQGYVSVGGDPIGVRRHGDRLKELPERAILAQRTRIGFVFQNFNLFPHLTALENVAEAPIATGRASRAEAHELARALLGSVGLADRAGAYPRQLSGGQQQRVAIARDAQVTASMRRHAPDSQADDVGAAAGLANHVRAASVPSPVAVGQDRVNSHSNPSFNRARRLPARRRRRRG